MSPTRVDTQGPSPEDYGLDAVARHNAATSTEQFPEYQENSKGLGIYVSSRSILRQRSRTLTETQENGYYQEDLSYGHNPPTPRSNTDDGIRTRSGRSTRGRTDSPFSTGKSRVSKSPSARARKDKKAGKGDKVKTPKLTAPLSVLTKDMDVPMKDMDAWVNRPADVRQAEVAKRNGYVTRPMNSFMLYRSAYAERTKQWCLQNNHQVVSSVSGESWPMEPEEVRNQFNEWAKLERDNHAKAHPDYKFSPSKATNKRRKGEFSDEEDDAASDLNGDPDGEYRGGRAVRQRRQIDPDAGAQAYLESNVGFSSHPYYAQQGYDQAAYIYAGRPVPSNVAYDGTGLAYNPQTGTYVHTSVHQHPQYGYVQDVRGVRVPTPGSINDASQTLGGYGMPGTGQMSAEDLFVATSRTGTPAMQAQYNQYGQPIAYPAYHSYTPQPYQQSQIPPQHMYEHQQYLQQASQPHQAIDPGLEAALAAAGGQGQNHFDDAIGDLGSSGLESMTEYFDESTSPNQTLAPPWSPTETLGGH